MFRVKRVIKTPVKTYGRRKVSAAADLLPKLVRSLLGREHLRTAEYTARMCVEIVATNLRSSKQYLRRVCSYCYKRF